MMYRCLKEELIYFENCVDFTFLSSKATMCSKKRKKKKKKEKKEKKKKKKKMKVDPTSTLAFNNQYHPPEEEL